MRKEYQKYLFNKTMNEEIIRPLIKTFKNFLISIISYSSFFVFLVISFIKIYISSRINYWNIGIMGYLVLFFLSSLKVLIRACINLNKLSKVKKIDKVENYGFMRLISILYIIFGFSLYPIILVFFICLKVCSE